MGYIHRARGGRYVDRKNENKAEGRWGGREDVIWLHGFWELIFLSLFCFIKEMNVGGEDNIAHMLITKAMQADDCHDNITAILIGL